ncbi:MAG: nucleoside monophosphate kinase [Holosporales bacterium]|jgi:adenylate kinase|nr:nucleoside monophosphate kinase [Holosporales bacterium]
MEGLWVVLLGAPGCGKGTQSEFLVNDYGFSVISVGDILRTSRETPVAERGSTVGELLDAGELLPDAVILNLVGSELNKLSDEKRANLLFDGFPRTVGQAEGLSGLAKEFSKDVDLVLNFAVGDDIVLGRILGRYKCSNCGRVFNDFFLCPAVDGVCDSCGGKEFSRRTDDNEVALRKRLSEYREKTGPLVDYYLSAGVLRVVDASLGLDDVRRAIHGILNKKEKE